MSRKARNIWNDLIRCSQKWKLSLVCRDAKPPQISQHFVALQKLPSTLLERRALSFPPGSRTFFFYPICRNLTVFSLEQSAANDPRALVKLTLDTGHLIYPWRCRQLKYPDKILTQSQVKFKLHKFWWDVILYFVTRCLDELSFCAVKHCSCVYSGCFGASLWQKWMNLFWLPRFSSRNFLKSSSPVSILSKPDYKGNFQVALFLSTTANTKNAPTQFRGGGRLSEFPISMAQETRTGPQDSHGIKKSLFGTTHFGCHCRDMRFGKRFKLSKLFKLFVIQLHSFHRDIRMPYNSYIRRISNFGRGFYMRTWWEVFLSATWRNDRHCTLSASWCASTCVSVRYQQNSAV